MLELVKLSPRKLEVGMFVAGLDRAWSETPFKAPGFTVQTQFDINQLSGLCEFVFVDKHKSLTLELDADGPESGPSKATKRAIPLPRPRLEKSQYLEGRELTPYKDQTDWAKEYPQAKESVERLYESVKRMFRSMDSGDRLDLLSVKQSVDPVIDSVARNPDTCIWLARQKQSDQYTHQHSVACAIWSVVIGRQLGLPKTDLRSLAIGGLLFDIGKLRVSDELLTSPRRLSGAELELVRQHVYFGAELAREKSNVNEDITAMILQHHERYDGSGYPDGLRDDEIHVFARIAGIVDCYDALTTHRSYAPAIAPSEAIKQLHEVKDLDFQAEIIEEFTQAVGMYPAGTLVELSSGQVAVVVSNYRARRLRPRVILLLDEHKRPLASLRWLDLSRATHDERDKPLNIVTSLAPGSHGIDLATIDF
ncbi:HD-GYP domain-containing protein [Congregibacter brevis]|uniref:HD-GYP domain-containing protein n=1 Tax=Congregibacter brevis TaxID=3081201 RepID=A0ABZ0IA68_9GAMM|nr:HD-GYP domain-containing protein [Congregibacter sp. IMCC45268]